MTNQQGGGEAEEGRPRPSAGSSGPGEQPTTERPGAGPEEPDPLTRLRDDQERRWDQFRSEQEETARRLSGQPPQTPQDAPPPGVSAHPPPSYDPAQGGWSGPPPGSPGSPPPGGPPPAWGGGYQSGYGYPARETEQTAIWALVLAIASFVFCPVVPAIAALVMASNAKRAIAASGGMKEGEGMAIAAQVISWSNLGLVVLVVLFVILLAVGAATTGGYQ